MLEAKTFEIFRAGQHTTSTRQKLSFTEADLNRMATAYNAKSPSREFRAPLVEGHPRRESDVQNMGEVESLSVRGTSLFARANVDHSLIGAVRRGMYKNRSAAFFGPHSSSNPWPGVYFLKHVGFLGKTPPAVKGMAPLEFAESDEVAFSEFIESDDGTEEVFFSQGTRYDDERLALHLRAKERAATLGISYEAAVRQLIDGAK